jgi:dipeptidyl aminopeptidase/acylaminoacyl peptidase
MYFINELRGLSILLIHGKADKVVSYKQSEEFFNGLKKMDSNYKLILYEGGHDWTYWNSQLNNAFEFFNNHLAPN